MRLEGIARRTKDGTTGTGTLLERVLVWSETTKIGSSERLAPFDLELTDGTRVRVELARKVRLEPSTTRDGKWESFEDEPYLAAIRPQNAPGPHVKVRVTRATLVEGDALELLAEDDAEYAFSELEEHRAAPKRVLAKVTARAIATGDDAKAILDRLLERRQPEPEKTKPKRPSRFGAERRTLELAFGGAGVLLLAIALAMKLCALSVDVAMLGVVAVVTAVLSWTFDRIPRFISDGKALGRLSNVSNERPGRIFLFMMILPAIFIGLDIVFDWSTPWQQPTDRGEHYNGSWVSAIMLALWGIALAASILWYGRAEARLFRVLLRAPPLPAEGPLARTWGSFEGIVRDPTPVTEEGEAVAIVHVVSEEVVDGSDPNRYTERVLSKGTFFVDAPGKNGRSIEVHPERAVWASTVGLPVPREKKSKDGKKINEYVRAVPLRGGVLVAGRVDRGENERVGRLTSTGSESLIFVAVREGQSARRECVTVLALRRLGLLAAVASIAIAAGTMIYLEPRLPGFNIPSSGD